jgi:hypothetical protein
MADDTYAAKHRHIEAGGPYDMGRTVIYTSETVKPGFIIYVSSSNRAYAAKNSDSKWSGVAGLQGGHDIDTAYTSTSGSEEKIPYYKPNGCKLNLILEATSPAVDIIEGDPLHLGTEDGKVRKYAYAGDAGDIQDHVGWADEALTVSVTDDKIIRARLRGG